MSAYILDPRTIDYLVAWARSPSGARRLRDRSIIVSPDAPDFDVVRELMPEALTPRTWDGQTLWYLRCPAGNELGRLLLHQNVRSVSYRYPNDEPGNLPGPMPTHPDFARIRAYVFRPVPLDAIKPAHVVRSVDCYRYQSCETPDWRETIAYEVADTLREAAIDALIPEDAPWGWMDREAAA